MYKKSLEQFLPICTAIFILVVLPCAGTPADPLADAVHYFIFDRDVNGDGKLQPEEIRDVRYYGDGVANQPLVSLVTNNLGSAYWSRIPVDDPSRGVTYVMDSLAIRSDVSNDNGAVKSMSQRIHLHNSSIKGDATVLVRIRIDSFAQPDIAKGKGGEDRQAWMIFNGEAWNNDASKAGGSAFGFLYGGNDGDIATNGWLFAMSGKSKCNSSLPVVTNTWYDVAYTISDNGISNEETGAHSARVSFLLRKVDPQNALHGNTTTFDGFLYSEKELTDCFYNEEGNAGNHLYIGAESDKRNEEGGKSVSLDINRLIMWDRALSKDELIRVLMRDSSTFRIGIEDGSSGEFGASDETPETYAVDSAPWRDFPSGLTADNPTAVLSFTPHSRDAVSVSHILRVKAAEGDLGTTTLSLTVNGRSIRRPVSLSAGEEAVWQIKAGTFAGNAANAIAITRIGGTAESFAIDMVELCGSWTVGNVDNSNSEFSKDGNFPKQYDAYPGNWRFSGFANGVTTDRPLRLRFFACDAMVKHGCTFMAAMLGGGSSGTTYTPFAAYLNEEADPRWSTPDDFTPVKTNVVFDIDANELNAGWNMIMLKAPTPSPGSGYWILFDGARLDMHAVPTGTVVVFR